MQAENIILRVVRPAQRMEWYASPLKLPTQMMKRIMQHIEITFHSHNAREKNEKFQTFGLIFAYLQCQLSENAHLLFQVRHFTPPSFCRNGRKVEQSIVCSYQN